MTTETQTIFTCDRCGATSVTPGGHRKPGLWLSLTEGRSDRASPILPVGGLDLCFSCADDFEEWVNSPTSAQDALTPSSAPTDRPKP